MKNAIKPTKPILSSSGSVSNILNTQLSPTTANTQHFKPCLKIRLLPEKSPVPIGLPEIKKKHRKRSKVTPALNRKAQSMKTLQPPASIGQLSTPSSPKSPGSPKLPSFSILSQLTEYEKGEIKNYEKIYYFGKIEFKVQPSMDAKNYGFDFDNGNYKLVKGDHLAYRYEIKDLIGNGSFGTVCECFDHKNKAAVAIKVLKNKKSFHHQGGIEISILKAIKDNDLDDSNNLIKIKFYFIFRNHIFLVFPLLNISVYEYLVKNDMKGLSLTKVCDFTQQILRSLVTLETLSLIHCDLKPENLLFTNANYNQLTLIDFGSSCFSHEKIHTYIQSRFYRAPEIILGLGYTGSIDIWSLGCLVFEMYTGKVLLPGNSEIDQLFLIIELLGLPPDHMIEDSTKKFFVYEANGKVKKMVMKDGREIVPNSKRLECGDNLVVDFVYKCLEWDPEKRVKPKAALSHPWFHNRRKGKSQTYFTNRSRISKNSLN